VGGFRSVHDPREASRVDRKDMAIPNFYSVRKGDYRTVKAIEGYVTDRQRRYDGRRGAGILTSIRFRDDQRCIVGGFR